MLRKRRRVGEGGVVVPLPGLDEADGEPDF